MRLYSTLALILSSLNAGYAYSFISNDNFILNNPEIIIGKESLHDLTSKLGVAKEYKIIPNSVSDDGNVCYVSNLENDKTLIVFASDSMLNKNINKIKLYADKADYKLSNNCIKTSLISRDTFFRSGIKIGITKEQLIHILKLKNNGKDNTFKHFSMVSVSLPKTNKQKRDQKMLEQRHSFGAPELEKYPYTYSLRIRAQFNENKMIKYDISELISY